MQISLHGAYYGNNFGDDLLLEMFVRWAREAVPGVTINLPSASVRKMRECGADNVGMDAYRKSRCLAYIGGGYFGEPSGDTAGWAHRNFERFGRIGLKAVEDGTPIGVFGVGAGPISDLKYRDAVRTILTAARVVSLRDLESVAFAESIGVGAQHCTLTADSCLGDLQGLGLGPCAAIDALRARGCAKVYAIHLSSYAQESLQQDLVASLQRIHERDESLGYVVLSDWATWSVRGIVGRYLARRRIRARFGDQGRVEIAFYRNSDSFVRTLRAADLVVSEKLHACIVSTSVGTPVISFPKHPKVLRLFQQIGAPELCRYKKECDLATVKTQISMACLRRVSVPPDIRGAATLNRVMFLNFIRGFLA